MCTVPPSFILSSCQSSVVVLSRSYGCRLVARLGDARHARQNVHFLTSVRARNRRVPFLTSWPPHAPGGGALSTWRLPSRVALAVEAGFSGPATPPGVVLSQLKAGSRRSPLSQPPRANLGGPRGARAVRIPEESTIYSGPRAVGHPKAVRAVGRPEPFREFLGRAGWRADSSNPATTAGLVDAHPLSPCRM